MALNFLNNGYFAGKVGIGTESPEAKLHTKVGTSGGSPYDSSVGIFAEGATRSIIQMSSTSDAYLMFGDASVNNQAWFGYNHANNQLLLHTGSSITMDGNVGIGTTSPVSPLTVKSSSVSSGESGIVIQANGNTNSIIKLGERGTDGGRLEMLDANVTKIALYTDGTANYINAGNVGIGTTSPGSVLHVSGGSTTIPTLSGSHPFTISNTNNSGMSIISGTDDAGQIVFGDESDADVGRLRYQHSDNSMRFWTNASEKMRITSSGNVGIGTTSPQAALHVAGSFDANSPTGNGVLMGFYSGTHGYMQLNGPSGGYIDFSTSGTDHKGRILYDNTGNYLRLDTNGSEKLRINSSGNVGIGTSIGINKLDVAGNINIQGGNGGYLTFNNGDANIVINNNGTGRDLSFKTYDGSSNAERMRIDKNGNVGIGTTSPQQKLDTPNIIIGGSSIAASYRANATLMDNLGGTARFYSLGADNSTGGSYQFNSLSANASAGSGAVMTISSSGALKLNTYTAGTLVSDASGNITVSSGGGAGGPYLPLTGGTMSGNIDFNDSVRARFGNGDDLQIVHDGSNSYIHNVDVGDLYLRQTANDKDIIFQSDDGSGGTATYLKIDALSQAVTFVKPAYFTDNVKAQFGNSSDLKIYHDLSTNANIIESVNSKQLQITQDNLFIGSQGATESMITAVSNGAVSLYYDNSKKFETTSAGITVTGGWVTSGVSVAQANVEHTDNTKALFGNGNDLEIYHDGSDSYIKDNGDGNLLITSNGASVQINKGTTENMAEFIVDGAVKLYYDSDKKLETGIVSVGTATTTGGTLIDGWITTTQANAINNTTIATTAYVNNKIALIPAGLVFQGTWNAATNTPTLTSGSGTTGNFYIVSVAGSTNLDGITDWKVGDWAVFIEQGASDQFFPIDNSSVLDGIGTVGS